MDLLSGHRHRRTATIMVISAITPGPGWPLACIFRPEDPERLRDEASDRAVVIEFELRGRGGVVLHAEPQAADGFQVQGRAARRGGGERALAAQFDRDLERARVDAAQPPQDFPARRVPALVA